ncbi:MAG: hypothetical protein ACHQRM_11465 [Bacteroidia bacterium]
MKHNLLLVCLSLLLFGCTVQKRLYTGGYYHEHNSDRKISVQKKAAQKIHAGTADTSEVADLTASANKEYLNPPSPLADGPGCDTLIMNSGEHILALNISIEATQIKYKTCDYPDGPVHIIHKKRVKEIHYAGGLIREVGKQEDEKKKTQQPDTKLSELGSDPTLEIMVKSNSQLSYTTGFMTWAAVVLTIILALAGSAIASLFYLLAIVCCIIARYSGKKALRMMEGDSALVEKYYAKAHLGKLLGSILFWIGIGIIALAVAAVIVAILVFH